jgi:VanZ family protein
MKKHLLFNYIPTLALALIILVLSLIPTDNKEQSFIFFQGMDKVIHGIMYAFFTLFLLNDYLRINKIIFSRIILLASAILFYSILMELLQLLFVESRSGEIKDILANMTGIVVAVVAILIYRKVKS